MAARERSVAVAAFTCRADDVEQVRRALELELQDEGRDREQRTDHA